MTQPSSSSLIILHKFVFYRRNLSIACDGFDCDDDYYDLTPFFPFISFYCAHCVIKLAIKHILCSKLLTATTHYKSPNIQKVEASIWHKLFTSNSQQNRRRDKQDTAFLSRKGFNTLLLLCQSSNNDGDSKRSSGLIQFILLTEK